MADISKNKIKYSKHKLILFAEIFSVLRAFVLANHLLRYLTGRFVKFNEIRMAEFEKTIQIYILED